MFIRKHWYTISLFIGLACLLGAVVFWDDLGALRRLSLLNLGVIFLHFFEEFGFPGGFPTVANVILYPGGAPDRYPLNRNNVMIGNWAFAVAFYVPPILFPDVIWLGLMPILFGAIGQFLGHAVLNNIKLATWYNSGLATTIFGHVPVAVAYISYVQQHALATGWDWAIAVAYAIFAYAVLFRRLVLGLADRNSPYPFDEVEMGRLDQYRKWASFRKA